MHGRSVPPWERMTIRLYCTYYRSAKRRYDREQGASGRVYEDLQDVPETLRDVAYYKQMKRQERDALAKEVILREIISIRNEFLVLSSRKFFQLITQNLPTSMPAGRDAFFRMMGANSLLIKKRKSYRPITTIS